MDAREERGLLIAAMCRVTPKNGKWLVPSQSGAGHYEVCLDAPGAQGPTCTCPDYEEHHRPCKHIHAVQYTIRRETNPDGSMTLTETITLTQTTTVAPRPTYRQNWAAYNEAQMNEKPKFLKILHALCQGIEEPPKATKKGRPRNPYRDMAFAGAYKVYSTYSVRRFYGDLEAAFGQGYLSKCPHFNSVVASFEDPAMTPILKALIIQSSLPLKAVETDFAVDSTGFTSRRFDRWYDHKYGKFMRQHDWVKVHMMCGVKTNIVTAVEILGREANDCPQLPAMVRTTAKNYDVREVSADKEYLSAENVNTIVEAGGSPYIAIKTNTTGGVGGLFAKMYHSFCLNRDDYLSHYHKRSNVESTVAMIKAKFGDCVRSKTKAAMTNEALCKVLCHNIACLISATYELGISVAFWGTDADDEPMTSESPKSDRPVDSEDFIDALAWV